MIELVPDETKNSRKKTYRISSQGFKLFNDWLKIPLTPEVTQLNNDDFVLRLHFLGKDDHFIVLVPPERRWYFSAKDSETHPLEITLNDETQILLDANGKISITENTDED